MTTSSIETYFWLVDRLSMEDDSRNKVNMSKNTVALSKPYLLNIETGSYIAKLMQDMCHTFESRTGKNLEMSKDLVVDPEAKGFFEPKWKTIFATLS